MNAVDLMTGQWLDEAGIGRGLRLLDIGCGPGVVTEMLARRVGPDGHVWGADIDAGMLDVARRRLDAAGLSDRVDLIQAGFDAAPEDAKGWDGVVGRRVLKYQRDPVAALKALFPALRPGGLVLFHEHDMVTADDPRADLPLHRTVRSWLRQMLEHEGAHLNMGHDLHRAFTEAGYKVEKVEARANVLTPDSDYPIAQIIAGVMPRLERYGIVKTGEVDTEALDHSLRQERRRAGTTLVWELVFCGWARKPAD